MAAAATPVLQPLWDNVLIEFEPPPKRSAGGLILLDGNQRAVPGFARVLAVGPGGEVSDRTTGKHKVLPRPDGVVPGARVLVASRACGMVVERPNDPHYLLRVVRFTEICAVVAEEVACEPM